MNIDDMILVSVDDHVIEPAHLFEDRVPKRYEDKAPWFVRRDDGTMAWRYNGQEILNTALNAVAGRPGRSSAANPPASRRSAPVATTSAIGSGT